MLSSKDAFSRKWLKPRPSRERGSNLEEAGLGRMCCQLAFFDEGGAGVRLFARRTDERDTDAQRVDLVPPEQYGGAEPNERKGEPTDRSVLAFNLRERHVVHGTTCLHSSP